MVYPLVIFLDKMADTTGFAGHWMYLLRKTIHIKYLK